MFWNIVLLIVGMVLLIKGADFFVDGASNIAKALKVPALIIGLTLVALGTSAPEASVSITSAAQQLNDLSVGNIIGSNIFNTILILGISSLIVPLTISKEMKTYDLPILLAIYGTLIIFSFVITPYVLTLAEGIIFLLLFVLYMLFLVLRAKQTIKAIGNQDVEVEKKKPVWLSIILSVVGLACIIFGGNLVVDNASELAIRVGMSEALVGLTIVSVGTSLPELVTSLVACIKKEEDIAVGNVVGSSIFNIIFILGMSATITPLTIDSSLFVDTLVMLGTGIMLLIISQFFKKTIKIILLYY